MAQMADIALYTTCTGSFLFDHPREMRKEAVSKMISICKRSVARFTQMGLSGKVKGKVVPNRRSYAVPREKIPCQQAFPAQ